MQLLVEVSLGEIIDKITILEIKTRRMADPTKLDNVRRELSLLLTALPERLFEDGRLADLRAELHDINAALWEIEDDIRQCEAAADFGERFIALARAVYLTNDRRAAVKKQINVISGSRLIEEKSYAGSL